MRIILAVLAVIFGLNSFAQKKVIYNGLNRNVPHKNSFGLKLQANYYFANFSAEMTDADSSSVTGSELPGGGFGAYYRYDFSDNIGIQTELFVHHRQGRVIGMRRYDIDTAISVYKEELSSYYETWLEIPVYFKYRKEFMYTRLGHWKSNSAISVYFGPRGVITPFSRRDLSRSTYSNLYGQRSHEVQNHINTNDDTSPRFAAIAGLGIAGGVDFEVRSGLILYASFYRGLLSYSLKSHGYKMIDNRIELGLGFRIY